MKRKILVSLGLIAALFGALVALAVNRANDIVAAFKPRIEQELSRRLDADVTLGAVALSLFPKTKLSVADISVQTPGRADPGLRLGNASIALSPTALLSKRLEVRDLTLENPKVTVVRDVDGTYIEGLRRKPKEGTSSGTQTPSPTIGKTPSDTPTTPGITVDLERAIIVLGEILFDDRVSNRKLTLSDVNLAASVDISDDRVLVEKLDLDLSVDSQLPLSMHATGIDLDRTTKALRVAALDSAIFGGQISAKGEVAASGKISFLAQGLEVASILKGLKLITPSVATYESIPAKITKLSGTYDFAGSTLELKEGLAQIPGGQLEITSSNLSLTQGPSGIIKIRSSGIDLAKLSPSLTTITPAAQGYDPSGNLILDLTADLAGVKSLSGKCAFERVGASLPNGVKVTNAHGPVNVHFAASGGIIDLTSLTLAVNGQPVTLTAGISLSPAAIDVQRMLIVIAGGELRGPLSIASKEPRILSAKPEAKGLILEQLLMIVKPDVAPKLTGTIETFNGQLSLPLSKGGMAGLNGYGNAVLVNGALKDFNIASAVLKKLDFIGEALVQEVPDEFKSTLQQRDTPIRKLTLRFSSTNGTMNLSQSDLESDIFTLTSRGSRSPEGRLDLDATIAFTPEFSASVARKVKEVRTVLSAEGRLVIPLTLEGIPPKLSVTPNVSELLEVAAKRALKDNAGKVLDKALGKEADQKLKKTLEGLLGF